MLHILKMTIMMIIIIINTFYLLDMIKKNWTSVFVLVEK